MNMVTFFKSRITVSISIVLCLVLILLSVMVFVGDRYLETALKPYREHSLAKQRRSEILVHAPKLPDLHSLKKATSISPLDAVAHYELGKGFHRLLVSGEIIKPELIKQAFDQAQTAYRHAIFSNQAFARAYFWRGMLHLWAVDGGLDGLSISGRQEHEQLALASLKAAVILRPKDPQICFETAAFYWRQNRLNEAEKYFGQSLEHSLQYLEPIISLIMESDADIDLLDRIIPQDGEYLSATSKALFKMDHIKQSYRYWEEAKRVANQDYIASETVMGVIQNDGFESPLGRSFNDWRVFDIKGVSAEISDAGPASGKHALTVNFDRAPINYFHVTQAVPVSSLASYRLSAMVKSQNLGEKERIGIEVVTKGGLADGKYLCGDAISSAPEWTDLSCRFTVPYGSWKAEVRLRRFAEDKAEGSGQIAFDEVRLIEVAGK